ncbi:MAG: Cna B-type domain-containing protein [Peptostreptococcaceae bacterium]|nr:Cna B-type domain-containing protein [Peptostreptococcaceae bacterium]MDY5739033.1 Cna B-type domain-containing protein [Anaerovoracaceae bacterium]
MKRKTKFRERIWAYVLAVTLVIGNFGFAMNPLSSYALENESGIDSEETTIVKDDTDLSLKDDTEVIDENQAINNFADEDTKEQITDSPANGQYEEDEPLNVEENPDNLSGPVKADGTINLGKIQGEVIESKPVSRGLRGLMRTSSADMWIQTLIGPDALESGALAEPGSVKAYKPIIEEDPTVANKWNVKMLVAARDSIKTSRIVLVMDVSTSMTYNDRIVKAKEAAHAFVNKVLTESSATQIALVTFGKDTRTLQGFTNNKSELNAAIDSIDIKSNTGTFTQAGIKHAQGLLDSVSADKEYMVLLSDGEPTYSYGLDNPDNYLIAGGPGKYDSEKQTSDNISKGHFRYGSSVGTGSSMWYEYAAEGWWPKKVHKYYNHGHSAIAESNYAKDDGTRIFSVGLQTVPIGTDTLKKIASTAGDFTEVTDVNQLTPVFNSIAGQILKTVNEAGVNINFRDGFQLPADFDIATAKHSPGSTFSVEDGKPKWVMPTVGTVYDDQDPQYKGVKYEYVEYTITINDNILKNPSPENGLNPLGNIEMKYKNSEGIPTTTSFPDNEVTPKLFVLHKEVTDNAGGSATDSDKREFNFKVVEDGQGDVHETIALRPGESKIINNPKKGAIYRIYEWKTAQVYDESNANPLEFTVTDYYNKFDVSVTGDNPVIENTSPQGGLGKAVLEEIPTGTDGKRVDLTFTNWEETEARAVISIRKNVETNTSITNPNPDKKFNITLLRTAGILPGHENEHNWTEAVKAGETNTIPHKMRFTTYTVTEDLDDAKPFVPKAGEQGKQIRVTLYEVVAGLQNGNTTGQIIDFTNVIDPEAKKEIKATKKWQGEIEGETARPDIYFQLYRSTATADPETVGGPVKVVNDKVDFGLQPYFNEQGEEYKYFVKEVNEAGIPSVPDNYSKDEAGLEVFNTVAPVNANIKIKKIFDNIVTQDTDVDRNIESIVPTAALARAVRGALIFTVRVTNPYGITTDIILPAGGPEQIYIAKYKGSYTVEELGATDYEVTFEGATKLEGSAAKAEFTVTDGTEQTIVVKNKANAPTLKKDITIKKTWDGGTDNLPASIQVQLTGKADNAENYENTVTITKNAEDKWENTVTVPTHAANGQEYVYTIKEVGERDGKINLANKDYSVTYDQADFAVTNTYVQPETDNLVATKVWINGPEQKPEVKFELWRSGGDALNGKLVKEGQALTNNAVDFGKQPATDKSGAAYSYFVKEVGEENGKVTFGNLDYAVTYGNDGLTITNTYVIPKGSFEAKKIWKDVGENITKPEIIFTLYRAIGTADPVAVPGAEQKEPQADGIAKWDDLELTDNKGIEYKFSVKETFKKDELTNANWKPGQFMHDKNEVVNQLIDLSDDGGKITVKMDKITKAATVRSAFKLRKAPSPKIKFKVKVTGPYGYKETFELAPNEEKALEGLYFGEYTVEETDTHGYTPSYSPAGTLRVTPDDPEKEVTISNTGGGDGTVVNKTVTKIWEGGNKPETVIELWRRVIPEEERAVLDAGATDEKVGEFTADDRTTEYEFKNLAKHDENGREYQYYAREPKVPENYKAEAIDDLTIKNVYVIPTGEVKATKKWINAKGDKPTIWFRLFRQIQGSDVEAVPEAGLFKLENGENYATWKDVEKTDYNGEEYIFSVKEVNQAGEDFTPEGFTKVENGLEVTNTAKPLPEKDKAAKTGDNNTHGMYTLIGLMAAGGLILIRRKKEKQDTLLRR